MLGQIGNLVSNLQTMAVLESGDRIPYPTSSSKSLSLFNLFIGTTNLVGYFLGKKGQIYDSNILASVDVLLFQHLLG
ncbi:hypothetical protein PN499_20240 [Kamptonema animale CS-326]|jgi:hypothetical protein|uniref:hypothetical protein n=1 Tax=Kamptonema animale TaxID=92934 RepID=UPI00232B258D|nr:hypothetical protein [Kamptonema animale]MDB9513530.1 hypothetical protein [Kamptonema animale CS-326]